MYVCMYITLAEITARDCEHYRWLPRCQTISRSDFQLVDIRPVRTTARLRLWVSPMATEKKTVFFLFFFWGGLLDVLLDTEEEAAAAAAVVGVVERRVIAMQRCAGRACFCEVQHAN